MFARNKCTPKESIRRGGKSQSSQRGEISSLRMPGYAPANGQSFPYPSLVVRARNGRVADNPEVNDEMLICRHCSVQVQAQLGAWGESRRRWIHLPFLLILY